MRNIDPAVFSIAVSGASGFVGRHLVSEANRRGIDVHAFTRTPDRLPRGEHIKAVDLGIDGTNYGAWQGTANVFVHLAGRAHVLKESVRDPRTEFNRVNVEHTIQAANEAFSRGVGRFIYVSSIGVHGTTHNEGPLSPASPLCPQVEYAISKAEAEHQLRKFAQRRNWDVVFVRPPLIYGPEMKGNLLRLLKIANSPVPLPLAGIDNKRSFVGIWNFIDFILYLASSDAVSNKAFIPADREVISTSMLVTQIRRYCDRGAFMFKVPPSTTRVACRLLGQSQLFKQLFESLWIECRDLYEQTGWQPPFSQAEQMASTVKWFVERNRL